MKFLLNKLNDKGETQINKRKGECDGLVCECPAAKYLRSNCILRQKEKPLFKFLHLAIEWLLYFIGLPGSKCEFYDLKSCSLGVGNQWFRNQLVTTLPPKLNGEIELANIHTRASEQIYED